MTTQTPTSATPHDDTATGNVTENVAAARQGAPAWIDLGTNDGEAAERFYGELFGWTFEDQGPDFHGYRLIRCGEDLIGGLMDTTGMPAPGGGSAPPAWGVYLHTSDIEATLARVPEAGGQVVLPAMPVSDQGTMGLAIDPAGALIGMWQPGRLRGMDLPLRAGTPVWFEVMSLDYDAALPFYRDVFAWDVHTMGEHYATHGEEATAAAGLGDARGVLGEGTPSHWRVYFAYSGVDAGLTRVTELGGRILDGPMESPFGRLATVADPTGATFQMIEADGTCPADA